MYDLRVFDLQRVQKLIESSIIKTFNGIPDIAPSLLERIANDELLNRRIENRMMAEFTPDERCLYLIEKGNIEEFERYAVSMMTPLLIAIIEQEARESFGPVKKESALDRLRRKRRR